MEVAGLERAEQSIAHCRFDEALRDLVTVEDGRESSGVSRRLRASVHALRGDDPSLAGTAASSLLSCRDASTLAAYLESSSASLESFDYLCAGVILAWAMDASATFDVLRQARDRSISEKRYHFAIGACERIAHHAVLFGDVETAKSALDEAMGLALERHLPEWLLRCTAAAARLALDIGDIERAERLLGAAQSSSPGSSHILLAPAAAAVALASGDETALRRWTSKEVLDAALLSGDREGALAATTALLCGGEPAPESEALIALRRVLLWASGTTGAVELFSLAARYGGLAEARFGAEALRGFIAADRRYIKAHAMLARSYLLFRSGERAAWIDQAGDAARAFNAMGMRRWMNEAMQLLVRQEGDNLPKRRRRAMGSALTGREQQVAHLIRRGARNREVAAALQISEHTVERHVSSILGRLGLRSRWQIADPDNLSED